MEFFLALLPAAGCAALMFVCFRMMRHADMDAARFDAKHEIATLREEVATLRDELDRAQSVGARGEE